MLTPTTDLSVDAIDFGDMSLWGRDDWPGMFAALRAERPVSWHTEPEIPGLTFGPGAGFWSLVRYDDVVHVSRHPDVFLSGKGTNIPDFPPEVYEFLGSMINMDPPRHTQFRLIVNRGFTPRQVGAIEQSVHERARAIVDAVAEKGTCDFVSEIAAALPLQIICDMMGIPESDYQWVFEKTNVVLGAGDPEYGEEITAAFLASQELWQYAQGLRADRLEHPRDDITTAISQAEVEGHSLTPEEFGSFFVLLVVAGNETTRNAISHGMLALTDNPDQKHRWLDDFAGVAPDRGRGDHPLVDARHPLPPDVRRPGRRARRAAHRGGPEGRPLVQLGEPRRALLRRPLPLRRDPRAQRARRLRWRRTALLPRRAPRPTRDHRHVRRAAPTAARHRGVRRARAAPLELHPRHQADAGHVPPRVAAGVTPG